MSGGVDSMVLLYLCNQTSLSPTALHCNFNLRGEDANGDEAFVQSYCEKNKIECEIADFNTADLAEKNKLSIQECARNLRYDWFQTFLDANPAAILLTGHHMDDSAETFIINLLRGTGLKGLTGIPATRAGIYRPLLTSKKSDIRQFAEQEKIEFRIDKSNHDLKYTRNKVREKVLPLLNEISPNFDKKLATLIEELKITNEFLDSYAEQMHSNLIITAGHQNKMAILDFKNLPMPIQIKLLGRYDISRNQINEISKLCDSETGAVFKNNAFTFLKDRKYIVIKKNVESEIINVQLTDFTSRTKIGNCHFKCSTIDNKNIQFSNTIAHFDLDMIQSAIIVTNTHKGLRIQPLGMKGSKLVSDILIDEKLNSFEKINQLVMIHQSDIIWVVGKTINQKYCVSSKTKRVLKIEMLE